MSPEPRRLPGVYFETETPRPLAVLPRMDVAVLVGFTAQSPQGVPPYTPVAVEDVKQFERLFGGDLALAWDAERGETVYAHLPRAVRAFFENGGRRCWVIRVGGADALQGFSPQRFLDDDLADKSVYEILTTADYLRYQSPDARTLRGLHAALEVEEATLIAVPDLVHRRAVRRDVPTPPAASSQEIPPDEPTGEFEACDRSFLAAPSLEAQPPAAPDQPVVLRWGSSPFAYARGTEFMLEEASLPDFSDAAVVYRGTAHSVKLYDRAESGHDYLYYRVRAEQGELQSAWSRPETVILRAQTPWELEPLADYSDRTLLEVQQALLRMCAARGDLFAVLALPRHYREGKTFEYLQKLRDPLDWGGEIGALSYGAIYHPWPVSAEGAGVFRAVPPDGAATGLLARRAVERGAWVAPANELLRGMVALEPPLSSDRYGDWLEAQVNLIRQEAKGFLTLCADTLADTRQDPELRSINVRRLLILLRLVALRLGSTLVFEPNDETLRRLVERTFEAVLDYLFERGAFRPARKSQAYQVVTGPSLNPQQSLEQGRRIAEIKVAPSEPLAFLTVRLVQAGDQRLVVQEV
ncbi:MAG TPA: hypothetical protein VFS50_11095 [Meiothermus sp.]|nr:hypothetical protein [Meiothermus sp.]